MCLVRATCTYESALLYPASFMAPRIIPNASGSNGKSCRSAARARMPRVESLLSLTLPVST
eukprot:2664468-Heterocapsa_arctica.AAC.1